RSLACDTTTALQALRAPPILRSVDLANSNLNRWWARPDSIVALPRRRVRRHHVHRHRREAPRVEACRLPRESSYCRQRVETTSFSESCLDLLPRHPQDSSYPTSAYRPLLMSLPSRASLRLFHGRG